MRTRSCRCLRYRAHRPGRVSDDDRIPDTQLVHELRVLPVHSSACDVTSTTFAERNAGERASNTLATAVRTHRLSPAGRFHASGRGSPHRRCRRHPRAVTASYASYASSSCPSSSSCGGEIRQWCSGQSAQQCHELADNDSTHFSAPKPFSDNAPPMVLW